MLTLIKSKIILIKRIKRILAKIENARRWLIFGALVRCFRSSSEVHQKLLKCRIGNRKLGLARAVSHPKHLNVFLNFFHIVRTITR